MTVRDYSSAQAGEPPRPHDLLWLTPHALADEAMPEWARRVLAAGSPVVVRRAPREPGGPIPVGVRGATRGERHAGWVRPGQIVRRITPQGLVRSIDRLAIDRRRAIAALAALPEAAYVFTARRLDWGVTGAVGYELASGIDACHVDSDLDLLMRRPQPMARSDARTLAAALHDLPVRCDIQIETPLGAMALADWAGRADQVLIKSDQGPFLSRDPWAGIAPAPRAVCQNEPQPLYR